MRKLNSSNPAVKLVGKIQGEGEANFQGILNKTMLSILLVIVSATFTWVQYQSGSTSVFFYMMLGVIGGFIVAIITSIVPNIAPISVPIYAVLEGLFLGGVSANYNSYVGGLIVPAVMITFGILLVMLVLYRFKVIRATGKFKKCILVATLGVAGVYLIRFIMSLVGVNVMPFSDMGTIGIVISLVVIVIASLNFIIDFDNIEGIVSSGAPKKAEWIGVFGILTTLVWLYLEIIRLLYILKND